MPRVKLNTPEVDSLNAVKKRVNKKNKAKYSGQEASAPVVLVETQQIYNGVSERLTSIVASIGEINAQLNLTSGINAPWASKAIDRYISATSASKKQISDLNSYLEQKSAELSNFSEAQLSAIATLQNELTTSFTEIIKSVNKLTPSRQQAIKKVFGVFVDDLVKLNQILQGTVGYKQSTSSTTRGIPVQPFKSTAQSDPEQEIDIPEKTRKTRSDKGSTGVRKKGSAGGQPATLPHPPDTPRKGKGRPKKIQPPVDESEGDTEEGLGYGGAYDSSPVDRMVGGLLHPDFQRFQPHALISRRTPISFPAMMRDGVQGGIFLNNKDYMPTRFL